MEKAGSAPDLSLKMHFLKLAAVAGLREGMEACTACKLRAGCDRVVPWSGPTGGVPLAVAGEGPGRVENKTGVPFDGPAGELLNWALEEVFRPRDDVPCLNIVSCRPPGDRDPEEDEADACKPWFDAQVRTIDPGVLVLTGNVPLFRIRGNGPRISKARCEPFIPDWRPAGRDIWCVPTWHPAYVLRQGGVVKLAGGAGYRVNGPSGEQFLHDLGFASLLASARSTFDGRLINSLEDWRESANARMKANHPRIGIEIRELALAQDMFASELQQIESAPEGDALRLLTMESLG